MGIIGNPIKSKEYFEYILSYSPYNNLSSQNYPAMLITTSLFDNRVLYSEPVKYIAKLRDLKSDINVQLLKCKMEAAGHGGMSGRDNAIKELSEEYSFILKTAKKIRLTFFRNNFYLKNQLLYFLINFKFLSHFI